MATLRVTDPADIPQLLDLIHDRWVDIKSIEFEEAAGVLRIPRVGTKRRFLGESADPTVHEGFIEFHHVDRYNINDTERIRFYDLNTVRYDPDRQAVEMECGVPLKVTCWVRQFEIRLTS